MEGYVRMIVMCLGEDIRKLSCLDIIIDWEYKNGKVFFCLDKRVFRLRYYLRKYILIICVFSGGKFIVKLIRW